MRVTIASLTAEINKANERGNNWKSYALDLEDQLRIANQKLADIAQGLAPANAPNNMSNHHDKVYWSAAQTLVAFANRFSSRKPKEF